MSATPKPLGIFNRPTRQQLADITRAEILRRADHWRDMIGRETAIQRDIAIGKFVSDIRVWHMLIEHIADTECVFVEPIRFGGDLSFALGDEPVRRLPENASDWYHILKKVETTARRALARAYDYPAFAQQARDLRALWWWLRTHHANTIAPRLAALAAAEGDDSAERKAA